METSKNNSDISRYHLQHLVLKRIYKQSHTQPIEQLAINRIQPENGNLLATVGGTQLIIYDNAHCGNNLDLMLHFVNRDVPHLPLPVHVSQLSTSSINVPSSKSKPPTKKHRAFLQHSPPARLDTQNESENDVDGFEEELSNASTEEDPASFDLPYRRILCCEWLHAPDNPFDAWLAFGACDGLIQIISVARSRVYRILSGHSSSVTCLKGRSDFVRVSDNTSAQSQSLPTEAHTLASASRDGTVRLWNLNILVQNSNEQQPSSTSTSTSTFSLSKENTIKVCVDPFSKLACFALISCNALTMEFMPHKRWGHKLLIAPVNSKGLLQVWDFEAAWKGHLNQLQTSSDPSCSETDPSQSVPSSSSRKRKFDETTSDSCKNETHHRTSFPQRLDDTSLVSLQSPHKSDIDCIRFLNESEVVSKSQDGRVVVWDVQSREVKREIRVRGFAPNSTNITSSFDLTRDLQYIAFGCSKGCVYIYHLGSGELITTLSHKRSQMPIKGCAFSHLVPPLNVVYVSGNLVWRWDYIDPQVAATPQPTIAQTLKLKNNAPTPKKTQ